MMTFWIIAAAMILVALLLLAPALLRKERVTVEDRDQQNLVIARERLAELEADRDKGVLDQMQFEQARSELEQALLIDLDTQEEGDSARSETTGSNYLVLGTLVVLVPALTISLYLSLGSPQLLDPQAAAQRTTGHDLSQPGEGGMPSIEEMLSTLVERLKSNPEDAEGWYMLGRTYMVLKQYDKASASFEKLYNLVGDEPAILLSWADAQAMVQQGSMAGKPAELVRKAVKLAPTDPTALWLAGMVEEQTGNFTQAVGYWERLAPLLVDDAESSKRVTQLIANARKEAGMESAAPTVAAKSAPAPAAASASVNIRVSISPALQQQVSGDETLFIYAKALQGPRMPLAAARLKVADLPLEMQLDDSLAMTPQAQISNFEQVVVGARVSRAGGAIAQSGDLRGEISPVIVGGSDLIEIVIDTVVP